MIFHENLLLADNSHVISYFIFVQNWERCHKILRFAVVVIGALRVKYPRHSLWLGFRKDTFCVISPPCLNNSVHLYRLQYMVEISVFLLRRLSNLFYATLSGR